MGEFIKNLLEKWFGLCNHKWKSVTKPPHIVPQRGSMCQWQITYECRKCKKTKTEWSDMYLGFTIKEDNE